MRRTGATAVLALGLACTHPPPAANAPTPAPVPTAVAIPDRTAAPPTATAPQPLLPPQAAMLMGLMPRRSIGIDQFLATSPKADGRGVLIAILDSGIDPGLPGMAKTTTGERKILDLRDFSGEGHLTLSPLQPVGDTAMAEGVTLVGFGRVRAFALPPYYAGVLRERSLGTMPAADLNGDGDDDDLIPIVVAKASDGWAVYADANGDGSLADESPVHDYAVAGEWIHFGPVSAAVNLAVRADGRPDVTLLLDTSGHGSHVAGIAAGHDLFGVAGFDGAAPGAQVLGLKIANNARGGVSVSGGMERALAYAESYAARRGLPLVVNLSFGVGNEERVGTAVIDSVVDAFALAHPDVLVVISSGNDGPGMSTVGFPGSAEFALTACALYPGVFAAPPQPGSRPPDDVLGWWSARGGEFAKPDLCAPGVAFSNVPLWHTGEEVAGGTSMAAPLLSGAAALLQSALVQAGAKPAAAYELRRAMSATASPIPGATVLDEGAGVPDVSAALRWLRAGHRGGRFRVRSLPDGSNVGRTAAYRPDGIAADDTVQRFAVTSLSGQPFARVLLRSDVPWIRAPEALEFRGEPATVGLRYDPSQLRLPGLYVGTVWARPESDTLAGAAFALTSAVVVPQRLDAPYTRRKFLRAGRTDRLFVDVPAGAGGLAVNITVRDADQHATLYLFEPGGQPFRDGSTIEVGGEFDRDAAVTVRGEDVQPGIYELVVAAPPTSGVTFEVTVQLPPVALALGGGEARLTNLSGTPVPATVGAAVVGAETTDSVRAAGTAAPRIALRVPAWADRLELDVQVARALWPRLTDFAVTVWDSAGRPISQNPLNYAFGRQEIPVDSLRGALLEVELLPGFALVGDTTSWGAAVTARFLATDALSEGPDREVTLGRERPSVVPLIAGDGSGHVPAGLQPVVEVTVAPAGGAPTVRRTTLPAIGRAGATP